MRKRAPAIALLLASLLALQANIGCTAIALGADPVVVYAERTERVAFETVDAFLVLEKNHDAAFLNTPSVHAIAEDIRKTGPTAFRALRDTISAYKHNRTPENKASIVTALAVVQQLLAAAQELLAGQAGAPTTRKLMRQASLPINPCEGSNDLGFCADGAISKVIATYPEWRPLVVDAPLTVSH